MKGDGHNGGCRLVHGRGKNAKSQASDSNNHVTSITGTSLTGEAVLVVIMFKGEKYCRFSNINKSTHLLLYYF